MKVFIETIDNKFVPSPVGTFLASYSITSVSCEHEQVYSCCAKIQASLIGERDTDRGNTIENRGCLFIYLFIYLYICMDVRKAFLYFDPRVFVLVRLSTPSQIALNRILWFIDQYPYHPRN